MKKLLAAVFIVLVSFSTQAQNSRSFQRDYADAKDLLHEGKYNEAMAMFQELSIEHEENPFYIYAHYYYALAALKVGKLLDANFKLAQLEKKYPRWEQMEELYYLRSIIAFESGDYDRAFSYISMIEDRSISKDAVNEKQFYLQKIDTLARLIKLQNNYPEDKDIAEVLAAKLNKPQLGLKHKILLEYLIQDFQLKASDYPYAKLKRTERKDTFNVALMLPFELPLEGNSKEEQNIKEYLTSSKFGRDKKYYEIYKGVLMAKDSLKRAGINIKLLVYDTKRDTLVVKKTLALPEFRSVDLIIGPVLEPTTKIVASFAESMQINMINPINEIGYQFSGFEHAFFALSSGKVLAESIHQYTKKNFIGTNVTIVHGSKKADSLAAQKYFELLAEDTIKNDTIRVVGVNLKNVKDVAESLSKSNMDNISHIVVFATSRRESQFIATYMMDPLEASPSKPAVIVPADWMEVDQFSYQQMRDNNLHFIYNGCVKERNPGFKNYEEGYRERWNMLYTQEYELLGYEIMKFFGMEMKAHGDLFNEGITVANYESTYAYIGFDFHNSTNNAYVPLIIFDEEYYFQCVNKTVIINEY